MLVLVVLFSAYLLGSIPFGVVLARARGIDLQKTGSGNIGATNAARALGKGMGAFVLLLDASKATLPILFWGWVFRHHPQRAWILAGIGAAALVGHIFSVFLGGQGGKGVATAFGSFLALSPAAALLGALTYALAYGATRISSVGSLTALLLFPFWLYLYEAPLPTWVFLGFAVLLILYRHEGNIRRLLRRQERRV